MYRWGSNNDGALGNGEVGGFDVAPRPIFALRTVKVVKLCSGGEHNMCLTGPLSLFVFLYYPLYLLFIDTGSVFVWGKAENGRLGLSVKSPSNVLATPRQLLSLMDYTIVDIAVGFALPPHLSPCWLLILAML